MFTTYTYQDYLAAEDKIALLCKAIEKFKASAEFVRALSASSYFRGENPTIARKTILRARKIEKHGSAVRRGVGGDRKAPDSPPQRRNPCLRERPAMVGSHAVRSRPAGATMCKWWKEQLGGASEDAQSYWQGRFAACTFVERVWHTGRPRNSWGVAPNPTRDAVP